jgi:hypothetical protein
MDAGWATTVEDAIPALVQVWTDALPGTEVSDGPWTGNDGNYQAVSVGYDGNDGAVHVETTPSGGGPNLEQYTVFCAAVVSGGDAEFAPLRAQALGLLRACFAALDADFTLGRKVLRAMPGSWALHQSSTSSGPRVLIAFGVQVEAFTKEV